MGRYAQSQVELIAGADGAADHRLLLRRGSGELIYVLDDSGSMALMVAGLARDLGYMVVILDEPVSLLEQVEAEPPHLVLLPGPVAWADSLSLPVGLRRLVPRAWFPIVVLESDALRVPSEEAHHEDVDDVICGPFGHERLALRLHSLIRLKHKHDAMGGQTRLLMSRATALESELKSRNAELERLTVGLVGALEKANLFNDEDTGNHIRRVCHFSRIIACEAGLEGDLIDKIFRYASLHDVGKVGIPDSILKKRGALTLDEFEVMKRHTIIGHELLEASGVDEVARNIAIAHHEKWDGTGYPYGLNAELIPIEARIVAIADVFDALTTERCYKQALAREEAVRLVERGAGTHFDPHLLALFLRCLDEVAEIQARFQG